MNGHNSFSTGKISFSSQQSDDCVLVSACGIETYLLTNKETGKPTLAAFDSKVAANRFFLENKFYHATKII